MQKITIDSLDMINSLPNSIVKNFFGHWTEETNLLQLKKTFQHGKLFEHVTIPNFLNKEVAELLFLHFPTDIENMHRYNNPIEVKYARDEISTMHPILKNYFYFMSSNYIIHLFSQISDIQLECDPFLHGAGLHIHPRNGRLGVHLDYEIHPYLQKQRRLNVIVYLNKNWNPEWNGQSELWNMETETCEVRSSINFNSAFVFKTNDQSWHGLSTKITCPDNIFRQTLAYYFLSDITDQPRNEIEGQDGSGYRKKAVFRVMKKDPNFDKLQPLLKIRPHRRIEDSDMKEHWPEWNEVDF